MDEAKNMALLFFIDHLMQKGGRRTVHDLSCQFGARGFTQEMRDAVGTTQEGLTDFLAQYPSLFALDDENIALRGYGDSNPLAQMPRHYQRDYVQEAIDFFVAKLHKFGPELQIKSLLGHRSQAAPEVRLISGRHLKEFVEFLQEQTDHFVVEADRVRLKNMPEPTGEQLVPEVMMDSEGQPLVGVKAKQAVLDYLRSVLEVDEDAPIPLDAFYRKFCDRFPHSVRQEVATNPKELLQFLKLNRNVFFIRSNKVSLVKARPEGDAMGENGSESGRESASDGVGPQSPARKTTTVAAINQNGNDIHEPKSDAILFPLDAENISKVELVKSLKEAQVVVASLRADLDAMVSKGHERYLVVDFKTTMFGAANAALVTANRHAGRSGVWSVGEEFISIVAIASRERMAVFDLEQSGALLSESGLKKLLEWSSCVKVIHEVRKVATLLAQHYSVHLSNVFDTQIAHSVIQHDKFSKPLAELRNISFVNLRRVYHPQSLMMSDVTPRKLSHSPSWAERPLSDGMLLAASEECHCLATSLYPRIRAQLPASHRQLFEEKCREALLPHGGGGRQTPHSAPPQLLRFPPSLFNVSPTVPERGVVMMSESGLSPGGIYRPPGARRGFSFGSRRQLISSQQPSFDQLQPLIPGLVNHFHPRCNSNASAESVSPTSGMSLRKGSAPVMSAPYRPLAHLSASAAPYFPLASISNRRQTPSPKMADAQTQTVSTGEITVLKVYYDEEEN